MTCSAFLVRNSKRYWESFMPKTLTPKVDFHVLHAHFLTSLKVGVSFGDNWNFPTRHRLNRSDSVLEPPITDILLFLDVMCVVLVSSVIHLLFLKASLYEVFVCLFLPGIGFFTLFVSLIKLVNLWAIFPQPSLWGLSGVIMIDLLPPWMTMKLMYLPLSLYFRELWKVVLHVPSLYCLPLFFCSCIEDEHQPLHDINAYSNLSH